MIKEFYSAIDAGELQHYLDEGYLVKGIFGDTLNEIKEGEDIDCLLRIGEESLNCRFITANDVFGLFKVTGIYEWVPLTEENVLKLNGQHIRLKKDVKVVAEKGSTIVQIGQTHFGSYALLDLFEHEDGSPVGELKEVSWF